MVGAMSPKIPFERNKFFLPFNSRLKRMKGTSEVECSVSISPVCKFIIPSKLPWSAVIITRKLFLVVRYQSRKSMLPFTKNGIQLIIKSKHRTG